MEEMLSSCDKLKQIKGLENFNTINVQTMYSMFDFCHELEYLDLSSFNTSNVTDMKFMFNECNKLKEIKGINNFNTDKVESFLWMFHNCKELEYLDLSNFNTSNVTYMKEMFCGCHKLKEIKGINNFNINPKKYVNREGMFKECYQLSNVDRLKFNSSFNQTNKKEENIKEKTEKKEKTENLFAVNFISHDQRVQYPMSCKDTDIFYELEEKLYDEYPELKNKKIYFLANGIMVNKNETLAENKIKGGNAIIIMES